MVACQTHPNFDERRKACNGARHPKPDRRKAGQADLLVQRPADDFESASGFVQHGGHYGGRPVRGAGSTGFRRLDDDFGDAVYRLSDWHGQWGQRDGGPLFWRPQRPRRVGNRPYVADSVPAGGRGHSGAGAAVLPGHAGTAQHQGSADRRRGALFAHLLFGNARHGGL